LLVEEHKETSQVSSARNSRNYWDKKSEVEAGQVLNRVVAEVIAISDF